MKKYVIDAWAWLEYLEGSNKGREVERRIKGGTLFTSAVTVSEVLSSAQRRKKDLGVAFEAMTSLSKIVEVDLQLAKAVGVLHATIKKSRPNFSFGDAFVLQSAINLNAKVLTGDPDFKGMAISEMIK